jgi:AcrR family transcriptional regulator
MRIKDETKEKQILDTALGVIAKTGLSGLKMTALAKEAGVATGTVYIYFQDKDELIRHLYIYLMKQSVQGLTDNVQASEPLKVRIKKITHNYFYIKLLHPERSAFFEQYFRSPYYQDTEIVRHKEESLMMPIYEVVVEGQQQGIIKEANPELLVTLICGMLNQLAQTTLYTQQVLSEADWELTFRVIWDGIKS